MVKLEYCCLVKHCSIYFLFIRWDDINPYLFVSYLAISCNLVLALFFFLSPFLTSDVSYSFFFVDYRNETCVKVLQQRLFVSSQRDSNCVVSKWGSWECCGRLVDALAILFKDSNLHCAKYFTKQKILKVFFKLGC